MESIKAEVVQFKLTSKTEELDKMNQTLLQELSNSDIEWLMATGKRQKVDADRLLIETGQTVSAFYLLIDGSLTVSVSQKFRTTRFHSTSTQRGEVLFAFGRLHDSDIDWMITNGSCQKFKAGSILLQEGRPAETLYLLLNGLVKVTISEIAANPLDLAFAALGTSKTPSLGKEIATLRPGEFIGEMPFGDTRLASNSVSAVEDSLVLAIPGQALKLKLQQDLGWAARFEEVIATLAAERFRDTINQLGYGRRFYSSGESLEQSFSYEDELDLDSLDNLNLAGSRFKWMLNRLQVLDNNNGQQEKQLANPNYIGI